MKKERALPKQILDAAQVTREMMNGTYGSGPTCARCFGFKENDGLPFCPGCQRELEAEASTREAALRKAVETSWEFPWITDSKTGIARMLTPDEICKRCGKAQATETNGVLWGLSDFGGKLCAPCGREVEAEKDRRRQEEARMMANTPAALKIYGGGGRSPREVVRIGYDGKITVADGYTMNEAAKAFWDAVAQTAPQKQPEPIETERQIDFSE